VKSLLKALLAAYFWASAAYAQFDPIEAARLAAERGDFETAEELLTARLEAQADDAEARLLRARVRSWAGRWDEASADYDNLLRADPEHADYLLGRAQVLLWSGSPHAAATLAGRARRIAPDYEDAWRLELQALLATSDPQAEAAAETLVREAQNLFPESVWLPLEPSPMQEPANRMGASVGHESLSDGYADWTSAVLDVEHEFAQGRVVFGRVTSTERFDLRDSGYGAGVLLSVRQRWRADAEVFYSPTGNVLPERALAAGVQRSFGAGWGVGMNVRHSEYQATNTSLIAFLLEKYVADFRAAYQLFRGDVEGAEATLSHVVRVDYYYGNGHSIAVALADGEEQESVGGGVILTTEVSALAISGAQRVRPAWSVTWTLGSHEQGALYRRDGLGVGFRHEF
jgi:YaiO family outer membrane protein